jgi:transcriptional regulator with XRE-family HTH domain
MLMGQRLKDIRKGKHLSQGDIEKATGLRRGYVSRVENGHIVPSVESIEKWAYALKMPLYQIFHEGEEPPLPVKISMNVAQLWGNAKRDASKLNRLRHLLKRMDKAHRKILLSLAARTARRSRSK